MPSLVVGVEAGSVAPESDSEEGLLLVFSAFDVLSVALDEAAFEGPGSVLRPVDVVASATFESFPSLVGNIILDDVGSMADLSDFSASASDVLASALKAKVLHELGPGVCLGAGSVVVSESAADAGASDAVLAVVACSVVAALAVGGVFGGGLLVP